MSDRKVFLCYSDDGGFTWSNWRERSLGEVGEYGKRIRFSRLGAFRSRIWRIRVSSPVKRDIIAASAQLIRTNG
jgi:hypothetical protein